MGALANQAGIALDGLGSGLFPRGRAAALLALEAGVRCLNERKADAVVVGGVDSYFDGRLLRELDRDNRILAPRTVDGFIPGEGAAFILLMRRTGASDSNPTAILAIGSSRDAGHRSAPEPARGEGLSGAIEAMRAGSRLSAPVANIYASLNGESFGAKEWGVARLRHRDLFAPTSELHHPAECDSQQADECPTTAVTGCDSSVPGQLGALRSVLALARRQQPDRKLDLLLLTVGANDVRFSSLVANVIVEATTERLLLRGGGGLASPEDAKKALDGDLPGDFARLRAALKPMVGGNLSRVVYVSYGNPAMQSAAAPCPGGRDGFDVHPAFGIDRDRLAKALGFVSTKFLPRLRMLATCDGKGICKDPMTERMTFVDGHQAAFLNHGVCARAADDPPFDRECFSPKGESFSTDPSAADDPLACSMSADDFRPYASRARWIRTANDSYFAAMTYPEALPSTLRPSDIHDATWGVLSAVYGGALHPTAEGYAAMADAALPAARQVLDLPTPTAIRAEPLPPPSPARRDAVSRRNHHT